MKSFISKIALASVMASAAFAGAASAETDVSVSHSIVKADIEALGVTEDAQATTFAASGMYENGLRFDAEITAVNGDTYISDYTFGEIDGRYMITDNFGAAASYDFVEDMEGVLGLGLAAEYEMDGLAAYATVTSDTEDFLDAYKFEMGGKYDLNAMTELNAEYQQYGMVGEAAASKSIELGARYKLANAAFVEGSYTYGMSDSADTDVFTIGMGFGF